jgi:hypothetical protein
LLRLKSCILTQIPADKTISIHAVVFKRVEVLENQIISSKNQINSRTIIIKFSNRDQTQVTGLKG